MTFYSRHSPLHRSVAVAVGFYLVFQSGVLQPLPVLAQATNPRASYRLGAGDQIEITVFGYEEYTGSKVILPDGTITLPIVGAVLAAGQTPDQLAQDLTAQLQPYLVDPVVTVSLSTLRPVIVNVAGEVQRPGPVQLRSLTTVAAVNNSATSSTSLNGVPTISSALIEAVGITQNADIRQVTLRRTLPGEEESTITINLWDALWSENAPEDLILQDGDSILVPRLTANDSIDRRLIARSSLSPSTVRVRVVGEVTRPGEVQVPPNSSLSSAVAIAGGPTEDAKLSEVAFVRLNEQGVVERQTVDLRNLVDEYQVQEGDVIVVPQTGTSSVLEFIGRIANPFNFIFGLFDRF
jgi:polysaccharide export outer membrane protein